MKPPLSILLLALALDFASCTNSASLRLELTVASSDPAAIAKTQQVLQSRFTDVLPSVLSTVKSEADGSRLIFQFINGSPDRAALDYLYQTIGRFRVVSTNEIGMEVIWFTGADIERAEVVRSNQQTYIQVALIERAGIRARELSTANIGRVLTILLDGEVILKATINSQFAKYLQFNAPDESKAELLAAILGSGELSTSVSPEVPDNGI
jgi:hypothetical protein